MLRLEIDDFRDAEYDLDIVGFEDDELRSLLAQQEAAGGLTDEDAVPEPPAEPVAQSGDLWILGDHRLICGDCISPEIGGPYPDNHLGRYPRYWSAAFELVPSIQIAHVWHARVFTREVLNGLERIGFLYPQQIIWGTRRHTPRLTGQVFSGKVDFIIWIDNEAHHRLARSVLISCTNLLVTTCWGKRRASSLVVSGR